MGDWKRLAVCFALAYSAVLGAADQRGSTPQAGAAISGRVTDAAGRPVPGVFITALRRSSAVDSRLTRVGGEPLTTASDGAYRIVVPALGEYAVVAIPTRQPAGNLGVGVTYYPNAASADAAKTVMVSPTGAATADIQLAIVPLASISGEVVAADGTAPRTGFVLLGRGDGLFGLASGRIPIQQDGRFHIDHLPPGRYFLHAREGDWSRSPAVAGMPKVSGATVDLAGTNVDRVRVVPILPTRVTGKVIVRSNSGAPIDPSTIRVSGFPKNSDGNPGPQRAGIVRPDMSFDFETWPAPGFVRVFVANNEIKPIKVRLNGADVSERGIDFVAGKTISGVEVEFMIR